MTVLDLCAYLGLAAVLSATLTLETLLSLRCTPIRHCPRRKLPIDLFSLYR